MWQGREVRAQPDGPPDGAGGGEAALGRRKLPATTVLAVIALAVSVAAIGVALRAETRKLSVPTTVPNVGIVEKDFAIQAPVTTATAGLIDFTVANAGPSAHEFLIFRANLAPDKLPLGLDGRVDENSDQVTKVFDSGDNLDAANSKTFHSALLPGTYVLVCNLPTHYLAGMHTAFTVH